MKRTLGDALGEALLESARGGEVWRRDGYEDRWTVDGVFDFDEAARLFLRKLMREESTDDLPVTR